MAMVRESRVLGALSDASRSRSKFLSLYQKHPLPNGSYSLDHAANLYIIDQGGELFSIVPYGLPPAHVLRVVRSLLEKSEPGKR